MEPRFTLERYDNDAQRIMDDGEIVGMALRLANNQWGLFDTNEVRVCDQAFGRPKDVLAHFSVLSQSPHP